MKFFLAVVILVIFSIIAVAIINLYLASNFEYLAYASYTSIALESKPIPKGNIDIDKEIKVDLDQQKAFLYEKGQFKREFTISSGKSDAPTPKGIFKVIYKQDMVYSKIASCWLSFWVGFTEDGKYGFHETPICEGKREGEDKIGTPASAGCLRLKLGDAEQLYNWAEIGTKIEIY